MSAARECEGSSAVLGDVEECHGRRKGLERGGRSRQNGHVLGAEHAEDIDWGDVGHLNAIAYKEDPDGDGGASVHSLSCCVLLVRREDLGGWY